MSKFAILLHLTAHMLTLGSATRIKQEKMAGARRTSYLVQEAVTTSEEQSSSSESYKCLTPSLPYRPPFNKITKSFMNTPPRRTKSRTRQNKRKRSSLEEEDGDSDDLEIDMDDSGGRLARQESKTIARDREIEHVKQTCNFKAIVSYDEDGDKLYLDSKQDLSDVCPDLWERIQDQHEAWERACGEEWKYDLERKFTVSGLSKPGVKPPCVTTKLLRISNGKAVWRKAARASMLVAVVCRRRDLVSRGMAKRCTYCQCIRKTGPIPRRMALRSGLGWTSSSGEVEMGWRRISR